MRSLKTTAGDRFPGAMSAKYNQLLEALPQLDRMESVLGLLARRHLRSTGGHTRVLDIGCGTGITSHGILQGHGHDLVTSTYIMGIDSSPVMVKQYKAWARKQPRLKSRHITIDCGQDDALDALGQYAPKQFHLVISGCTLHNIELGKREAIIREIHRVLAPGGLFLNGDKILPNDVTYAQQLIVNQIGAYCKTFEKTDPAYALQWMAHDLRDYEPDLRNTEKDALRVLKMAGFKCPSLFQRFDVHAITFAEKSK